MGRIAAIAGGDLQSTKELNLYALNMTDVKNPNVLFIPTASRDDQKYIKEFTDVFNGYGSEVKTLEIIRGNLSSKEIDKLLDWAKLIYVGGGNTVYMMNAWKNVGLDEKLKKVFSNDSAVLSGNGAGCACWFNCGYSNSQYNNGQTDWQYIWADNLLDLQHNAVCPHYNDEGRSNFDRRLLEKEIPGFGLEDNTALIQIGEHTEFIASHPRAKAFYLIYLNSQLLKKEIDLKYL